SDDIRRATDLARRMVTEWGMSEKLGPLRYEDNQEEVFLGHSVTMRKNLSDSTASAIDAEIRRLVQEGEAKARGIITERIEDLHTIAKGLLEHETLSADEIRTLLRGEPIVRPTEPPPAPKAGSGGGRRGSVPTSGPKDKGAPGGLAPEPQPGA
ncbi:MAG: cell division protein FtsH, partial [Alphaproteobacteria bacterium]|nr:cell division protein FtsH [Alphaproteobacteria bacterium]